MHIVVGVILILFGLGTALLGWFAGAMDPAGRPFMETIGWGGIVCPLGFIGWGLLFLLLRY